MAIVKNPNKNVDKTELSSSKNVGKANSKDIKKRQKINLGSMNGVVLQLDEEGKAVAPAMVKKKDSKKISDMVKDAKN